MNLMRPSQQQRKLLSFDQRALKDISSGLRRTGTKDAKPRPKQISRKLSDWRPFQTWNSGRHFSKCNRKLALETSSSYREHSACPPGALWTTSTAARTAWSRCAASRWRAGSTWHQCTCDASCARPHPAPACGPVTVEQRRGGECYLLLCCESSALCK